MKSPTVKEFAIIDLTPMLDVVFIMLIFFIVTASFIKDSGVEVDRPDTLTAEPGKFVSMIVGIDAASTIWVDHRRVDPREVRQELERLQAENPKGGLVIQADTGARAERVMLVLQTAAELGIERVAVAGEHVPERR